MSEQNITESLKEISELIKELLVKQSNLESRIDQIEARDSINTVDVQTDLSDESKQDAVYHTIKRIQNLSAQRSIERRESIEKSIDNAIDAILEDYKNNPPRWKR